MWHGYKGLKFQAQCPQALALQRVHRILHLKPCRNSIVIHLGLCPQIWSAPKSDKNPLFPKLRGILRPVRYLILSDIHANHLALEAVLSHARLKRWEKVLFLGDAVGYYTHPNEVLDRVDRKSVV